MSLLQNLPVELENIIQDYKTQMEKFEENFQILDDLFYPENPYQNDDCCDIKMDISYLDLRDYLFKENIIHIKFKIAIYGKDFRNRNHKNNNKFWDLDIIRDDDSFLENYDIDEISYSIFSNKLYISFNCDDDE